MRNLNKLILIAILFFIAKETNAQQLPIFSQYMFNDYVINPGVAGTVDHIPFRVTYRNQWTGFPGAPKTITMSAHSAVSNHVGLGGLLYSDDTGDGAITLSGAMLSYNFRFPISGKYCEWDKRKFLSLSLSTRLNQFSINNDRMFYLKL